ncbi:MAG: hypothetical protein LOY03_06835 [Cyclobacteriaceae bacterium]|nr:hypothetical protein [Cyclobacteriaceae bacterium]
MKTVAFISLSYMLALLSGGIMMGSCSDEEAPVPATIAFSGEFQTVTEGEDVTIDIVLDHPSPARTKVRLTVDTKAVYGKDYETDPVFDSAGQAELFVEKGQDTARIMLRTLDDTEVSGSRFVVFKIVPVATNFQLGKITTHTVIIHDDESPSVPYFRSAESRLQETNAAGQEIVIQLSSPVVGEGSLTVGIEPGNAVVGTHFTIDPEFTGNKYTFNLAEGDSTLRFTVFPVDNNLFTGDFELKFDILSVSGVVQMTKWRTHWLTIMDDEVQSVAEFAVTSATVGEADAAPHEVDLLLSSPVKGKGQLQIKIGGDAEYGVDFVTIPEAQGNVVILELSQDQETASFVVVAIDDGVVNGDLTIPFSIDYATGPILLGGQNQGYVLTVADDEKHSVVVGFASAALEVEESSDTGVDFAIELSHPAAGPGKILIDVLEFAGQIVSDPPVEQITTSYYDHFYQITVDVPDGADRVRFHVDPVNNTKCGGNKRVRFLVSSATGSVALEGNPLAGLTILEDEPHISVRLREADVVVTEGEATRVKVELEFSEPAATASEIFVYPFPYWSFLTGRYATDPNIFTYSSFGEPYGYLNYEAGATSVSFEIIPEDDNQNRGGFKATLHFEGTASYPCLVVEDSPYVLTVIEDDE